MKKIRKVVLTAVLAAAVIGGVGVGQSVTDSAPKAEAHTTGFYWVQFQELGFGTWHYCLFSGYHPHLMLTCMY